MNLLLDTHALLWALAEPRRLPERSAAAVAEPRNSVYVSAVSTWEIAIKMGLGRLEGSPGEIEEAIRAIGFSELPVSIAHSLAVHELPSHHRDPFDRLLIAQALAEGMTLVSGDPAVALYPVHTLWA